MVIVHMEDLFYWEFEGECFAEIGHILDLYLT